MQQALLLDKNYMALSVISWKKAVRLLVKGKAEPVSENSAYDVPTLSGSFGIPTILRLVITIPWKAHQGRMRYSNKNVFIRDNYECQYCGVHLGKNSGTIDHVLPSSRGGKTSYENCVASCKSCNNKKGNRTPAEAKMPLRSKPRKPTFAALYRGYMNNPPVEWSDYIIGLL